MKLVLGSFLFVLILVSCRTAAPISNSSSDAGPLTDTLITQSLFNDKASSISEENIQSILNGNYKLPQQLRIAIVRMETKGNVKRFSWNDEDYIKTIQAYQDLFAEKLKQSPRITKVSIIPDLLISKSPSFTSIREAGVRMQTDIVLVYSITSDTYAKYKFFARPEIKAFATTQLILMDLRTGLIPFSTIVTKDVVSQRKKEDTDIAESNTRVQNEATLLTINEIGQQLTGFFNKTN